MIIGNIYLLYSYIFHHDVFIFPNINFIRKIKFTKQFFYIRKYHMSVQMRERENTFTVISFVTNCLL